MKEILTRDVLNILGLALNILVYREEELLVAHCPRLDIVATGKNVREAKRNLADLCEIQIDYAVENDNMGYSGRF